MDNVNLYRCPSKDICRAIECSHREKHPRADCEAVASWVNKGKMLCPGCELVEAARREE